MREEKIKAFVTHIVEECEQEDFTLAEAFQIPQLLRFALNDRVEKINRQVGIRGVRVVP